MEREGVFFWGGTCLSVHLVCAGIKSREEEKLSTEQEHYVCIGVGVRGRGILPFSLEWRRGNQYSLICRNLNQFPIKFSKMSLAQKTNNDMPALSHTEIPQCLSSILFILVSPSTLPPPPPPSQNNPAPGQFSIKKKLLCS